MSDTINSYGDTECDRLMSESPRIYIAGHSPLRGYAVKREYQRGDECRFYESRIRAFTVVERWNRMAQRKDALGIFGRTLGTLGTLVSAKAVNP